MSEKRNGYRRPVLKTGFIILSDKAPRIECTVRNLSDTGAALKVSTTVSIPGNFEAIIDGVRRRCRTTWRTDTKLGVMFKAPA